MAKTTLPNYVSSALAHERKAQIGTYAAVALYVFAEVKADREVTELGERLHAVSPHRTVKTWQNYAAACTALAVNAAAVMKLESLWSQCQTGEVGEIAPAFQSWLESQLKAKGYTTSVDDVANYAKGKPSIKAKAKAEAEEQARIEAEAQAALLAAAKNPAPAPAPAADAAPVDGDPVNPLPASAGAGAEPQAPTGDENGTSATGYPPAIETTIVSIMRAFVKGDALDIVIEPDATRADLVQILEALQAHIDQMPPEANTLPVIDLEMAQA